MSRIARIVDGDKSGPRRFAMVAVSAVSSARAREPAPGRGPHVWVGLHDHELADGEPTDLYGDLYARAGERWVRAGRLAHFVIAPADDEPQLRTWFSLGFGQEQVHAERATYRDPPPMRDGIVVRRADLDDLETLLDLGRTIHEHQVGPSVWSGLSLPERDAHRQDWTEMITEDFRLPRRDRRRGGRVRGSLRERSGRDRAVGGSHTTRRARPGSGVVARRAGAARGAPERVLARSARLPLDQPTRSRFWLRLGFKPTRYRLRRDVQPYA